MKYTIIVGILFLIMLCFAISPKCLVIKQEQMIAPLNLEGRTDLAGVSPFKFKVFQKKNTDWYQCKTRISRLFFA